MSNAWWMLIVAGIFECFWAIGLKYTNSFSRLVPSLIVIVCLAISMFLLAKSAETLDIGTAYPVWVGIGAIGSCLLGALLFKESLSPLKLFFLCLLVVSVIGLKLSSK